ncbi:glycosyl hydrolase family 18 protein [Sulfobacillus harzensis]|uniref:Glycoside hydrolase n=1 Tax=Sulfobacillus harzensis TaxID=2729629 RepID=A0A7Y0Q256_9FIRM|nr:glycosyl hydrolase family 18 protein [Sulfobacillus harzensis]NMP20824.1 glycoside hydrolase [Sulfobacillus harzensis]
MTTQDWRDWLRQNRTLALIVGGVIVVLLAIWAIDAALKPHRAAPMPAQGGTRFQVIGFYENKKSRGSFDAHKNKLTTVSPLWFSVNAAGTVNDTGYDNSLVVQAHKARVSVMPLFINAGGNNTVLLSAATRQKAAASIAQVVKADHLDGVDIDFELLAPSSRDALSAFVKDVAAKLHPLHKAVEVSVFPLTGISSSISNAYNYTALAKSADYLVVMTYDHHYSGGPPGPVAPYGWVKTNVEAALKAAPAKKLVLAIGMYGYDWVNNGAPGSAPTIPDVEAKAMAKSYGVPIRYIAAESQNRFTYTAKDGTSHVVWFMGDRSAKARVALARQYHLGGISLWELGQEDPAFWSAIP